MTIDQKIFELRQEQKISQNELAEKLGISRQSVSKWENGTSIPSYNNIQQLAEIFNVEVEFLLNDNYKEKEETKKPPEQVEEKKKLFPLPMKYSVTILVVAFIGIVAFIILSYVFVSYEEVEVPYSDSQTQFVGETEENSQAENSCCIELVESKGLTHFLSTYHLELVFFIFVVLMAFSLTSIIYDYFKRRKNEKTTV